MKRSTKRLMNGLAVLRNAMVRLVAENHKRGSGFRRWSAFEVRRTWKRMGKKAAREYYKNVKDYSVAT